MRGWRTALRIARREARRAKGRSALVVAMIAVPVAVLAFTAVTYDTFELTPQERAERLMGAADAAITWTYDGPVAQHPISPDFFAIPAGPASDTLTPRTQERLLALLPPGTRTITDRRVELRMRTATGVGLIGARMLDYSDEIARGIYRPVSGHAPSTVDEVALTAAAMTRLGAAIGGSVQLADGGRTLRIVGTVENPDDLAATTMLLRPGAVTEADVVSSTEVKYLVDTPTPVTWDQIKRLNAHGVVVVSREVMAHPPDPSEVPTIGYAENNDDSAVGVGLVAGLALLEVVLLAGPAFAVGARRRRRDLALVAATGGTPGHLRRIVLADGVVLGGLAALGGVGLGVLAGVAGRPILENLTHIRSGGLRLFPLALAVLAGLSLVTGVLAALVPAWMASRQDVVTSLAGRRGVVRSRKRWLVVGLAMVAAGAGVAGLGAYRVDWAIILIGLAIAELGLILCTPSIVGVVARLGQLLPVAPRVALRDTARNRTSAAPAISAVMAAVVGSLAVGVMVTASTQQAADEYRTLARVGDVTVLNIGSGPKGGLTNPLTAFPPATLAALRSTLPVGEIVEVGAPSCGGDLCELIAVLPESRRCPFPVPDDGEQLPATEQRAARRDPRCDSAGRRYTYLGFGSNAAMTFVVDEHAAGVVANIPTVDMDAVASALRAGSVVAGDPSYVQDGRVSFESATIGPNGTGENRRTLSAPGLALPHPTAVPVTLMTAATARSLGFEVSPLALVVRTTRVPTIEEQDRAQAALGQGLPIYIEWGRPAGGDSLLVLTIVAAVITLAATAIATGLAAADGRADVATLGAVGASPRMRRQLSLWQSGVIAGLGSLLGTVAGVGLAVAVLVALNQRYADIWPAPTPFPVSVPWLNIVVTVVVVPLVAMVGAGLLTRSRLPIERRL